MDDVEYIGTFARTNLCAQKWSADESSKKVVKILSYHRGPLILMGMRVIDAFFGSARFRPDILKPTSLFRNHGEWSDEEVEILPCPHPSGRNRVLNDRQVAMRMRHEILSLVARNRSNHDGK